MFTNNNSLACHYGMHSYKEKQPQKTRTAANIFDNYDVKYLHRRLTAAGLNMLENLRELTYAHAAKQGNADAWTVLWKHTLPSIAYYNQYIQRSVAKEVTDMVPDIEKALQCTFQLYCKQCFGRDVHGNINIIRGSMPPFSEFYHCFLTRLCADPTTVRLLVFDDHTLLSKTVKNAILDALRDSSVDRVQIIETITESQFRERMRELKDAKDNRKGEGFDRRTEEPVYDERRDDPDEEERRRDDSRDDRRGDDRRGDDRRGDDESWTERSRVSGRISSRHWSPSPKRCEDVQEEDSMKPESVPTAAADSPDAKSKRVTFTINDPVATPPPLVPLPPKEESKPDQSVVSVQGSEWLKQLEKLKPAKPFFGELGPDDSASSINSLGKQAQLLDPGKNPRRISMVFESSSTPSREQGQKASFSEKMSLL